MTREEAISIMKVIVHMLEEKYDTDRIEEALDMAIKALETASCIKEKCAYCPHCEHCDVDDETLEIKALEQEPCEDCISRQAVLAIAGDSCLDLDSYEDTKDFCDEINELPPVTPKPKTGHWIKVTNGRGGHECDVCHDYAPSFQSGDEYLSTFCPNCGAKMERSDKE